MEHHDLLNVLKDWLIPSVIGAVFAFILGIVWYHPKVLGERWLAARGKATTDFKGSTSPFIVTLPLWFLSSLFFTFMVIFFQITAPSEIFLFSCMLWVAFAMPPLLMGSLYTGYPFEAVAIDASYQLAGYYIIAVSYMAVQACHAF